MGVSDHAGSWLILVPFIRGLQKDFDSDWYIAWFNRNWSISVYAGAVYLLAVFGFRYAMEKRRPFDLRRPLVLWNVLLTAFSLCGVLSMLPNSVDVIRQEGLHYSMCINVACYKDPHLAVWGLLFAMSKLLELGDTFFIVARKTNLEFLHWYHHITVTIFTWYAAGNISPMGQWFASMNYIVHSIMYGYFACKAARLKMPGVIARYITLLQLAQMFVGLFVLVYVFVQFRMGVPCNGSPYVVYSGLGMYASYAMLFMHFFYKRYLSKPKTKSD